MPGLNFTKFVDQIESGRKRQTIRRKRKRPIKPGDMLYLWTGQRTKQARKLGESVCVGVTPIRISERMVACPPWKLSKTLPAEPSWREWEGIVELDGKMLSEDEVELLAVSDGFQSSDEFFDFFIPSDEPFEGDVIMWGVLV